MAWLPDLAKNVQNEKEWDENSWKTEMAVNKLIDPFYASWGRAPRSLVKTNISKSDEILPCFLLVLTHRFKYIYWQQLHEREEYALSCFFFSIVTNNFNKSFPNQTLNLIHVFFFN